MCESTENHTNQAFGRGVNSIVSVRDHLWYAVLYSSSLMLRLNRVITLMLVGMYKEFEPIIKLQRSWCNYSTPSGRLHAPAKARSVRKYWMHLCKWRCTAKTQGFAALTLRWEMKCSPHQHVNCAAHAVLLVLVMHDGPVVQKSLQQTDHQSYKGFASLSQILVLPAVLQQTITDIYTLIVKVLLLCPKLETCNSMCNVWRDTKANLISCST